MNGFRGLGLGQWRMGIALGAVLGTIGCDRGSAPADGATHYRLRVDRVVGPERSNEGTLVRDSVAATASGARWFSAQEGAELPTEVRYAELDLADGAPVLRVEIDVDPPEGLARELPPDLSATVELTRAEGPIAIARDLPVALERGIAVLDARLTLARGDDSARAALLQDADAEIVLLGLDWVEANRARDLADAVVLLVDHAQERVALRAVECMGTVGGPQHVRALIRRPRIADAAQANKLYDALANLGGDHAIGFLEFAARNEDDPDLAKRAQRALARIQAEASGGGDGGGPAAIGRGHRVAAEDT